MKLKAMKCPVCGGVIEIKEDSDTVVCEFCKTPLYIEEDNLVRIKSKVRIKEIEHETARYKMALDDKEKARNAKLKGQKEENRHLILVIALPVILLIVYFAFVYGGHGLKTRTLEKTVAEIQEDINNENFDDARVKVESLRDSGFSSDDKKRWNQTRKELTKQINAAEKEAIIAKSIPVPAASSKIKGMNYSDVVELFEEAGFTNVKAIESSDKEGFFHDANEVKEISIAGDKRFKEGDVFLGMNMRAINLDGSGVHIMSEDTGLDRELGDILKRPLKPGISCIIVKSAGEAAEIMRQQKKYGTVVHDLTASPSALYPNHWNMMTVGQAKGLEFETVIVFSAGMSENEKYIAYTRALDELYIYDEDLLKGVKKEILVNDKVKDVLQKQETRLAAETRPKRKQRTKTSASGEKQDALSVKEFFEKRGIEVIDDRNQSGFLWVIGTEDQIGTAVNEAVSRYGIYGMYGRGKVSKNKPGWFTKTKK